MEKKHTDFVYGVHYYYKQNLHTTLLKLNMIQNALGQHYV